MITPIQEVIQTYAQLHSNHSNRGLKYQSFYDLVAAYGRQFTPMQRPKSIKRGIPSYCYYNATQIAKRRRYTYCEGFYVSKEIGFPVAHAWLTDGQGNAIDPTLEYKPEARQQYFGVALAFDFVKWHQGISGEAAIFESDHMHGYKLLKEGFPPDAVLEVPDINRLIDANIEHGTIYTAATTDNGYISIKRSASSDPTLLRPADALIWLTRTLHKVAEKC